MYKLNVITQRSFYDTYLQKVQNIYCNSKRIHCKVASYNKNYMVPFTARKYIAVKMNYHKVGVLDSNQRQ